jgi:hypothetical protein
MRNRRKKIKITTLDSIKKTSCPPPELLKETLVSETLKLILTYVSYTEGLKKEYFSEETILKIYLQSKKQDLFALHFEEYLEKALSYTYKTTGPVDETLLLWILKDTPINPFVFSVMKNRFEKYLKQE